MNPGGASDDPELRLAHLHGERQRIEDEIRRIEEAGTVASYQPAQIRERFATAVSLLKQLQGDFRGVEEKFKEITQDVQQRQSEGRYTRGGILEFALDAEDLLKREDQGVSFYEFVRFIFSPSQQERLQTVIQQLGRIQELAERADGMETVRRMVPVLLAEAEKVMHTNSRLSATLRRLLDERAYRDRQLAAVEEELTGLRERVAALHNARKFTDFSRLDYAPHEKEIKALRREQMELEENNVAVRLLKSRLGEAESRHKALQASRDGAVRAEGQLEREIEGGQKAIASAQSQIRNGKANGTFERHAESFSRLEACFADDPLTAAMLVERSQAFVKAKNAELDRLHREIEPVKGALLKLMTRFVHDYPEVRTDLDAGVEYLDSFLEIQEQIRREDLPRHEQRFKERLNEKVIQEIGLLNGALQTERREILDKIDLLNASLRQLEYCPGTHMRLDPRPVRDIEIAEFQDSLKQCLAGTFEGTVEADEARYLRIEKLLTRLREDQYWRDRVTDVRRWFDFGAQELANATGNERGYYRESTGQSGGEKAKLAFTILVAAIAYQYNIDPERATSERFHFVVVDEMFSKVDDQYSEYALDLFEKFGLQLLIVAPLDAKARVTEPYVGCYLHAVKDPRTNRSELFSMTAREFEAALMEKV